MCKPIKKQIKITVVTLVITGTLALLLFPSSSWGGCDYDKEDLSMLYTGVNAPPNIMWFIDSSGSMRGLPCEGNCKLETECGVNGNLTPTIFTDLGYDPNTLYPVFYPQCDDYANSTSSPCFDPCHVYLRSSSTLGNDACSSYIRWSDVGTIDTFCTDGSTASCQPVSGWICDLNNQAYPTETTCVANCSGWVCDLPDVTDLFPTQTDCQNACVVQGTCTRRWGLWWCSLDGSAYWTETECLASCQTSGTCTQATGTCTYSSQSFSYSGQCATTLFQQGYMYCDTTAQTISNCTSGLYYFVGNLLNYYPPKFIVARKVFRDLIARTRKIRMGLMTFDLTYYNSGGYVQSDINPTCDLLDDVSAYDATRQALFDLLDNLDVTQFWTNTPIGEALMNIGQYFACDDVYSSYYGYNIKTVNLGNSNVCDTTTVTRAICAKCQKNFTVLVTDGLPTADCDEFSSWGDRDGDLNPEDVYRGDDCLDDVSFLEHQQIDLKPDDYNLAYSAYDGAQNMVVYTVSFGLGQNIPQVLLDAASNGGGLFYSADTYQELVNALEQVLIDILKRTMSFTRATVETTQTSESNIGIVARFKPSDRPIWYGYVYQFQTFSEILNKVDKNGDGDTDDILLIDADGDIVEVNLDGDLVKAGTNTPANYFWEAGEQLLALGPANRNLYTVVDSNGDGVIDGNDGLIAFDATNASQLVNYLQVATGTFEGESSFCAWLSKKLGLTLTNLQCAEYLINFVRGVDVLDWDADGDRTDTRPWLLGDIFHTSPQRVTNTHYVFYRTVDPDGNLLQPGATPVSPLCNPFFESRCFGALWSYDGGGNPQDALNAFFQYVVNNNDQTPIVLTASNDGILHAFNYTSGVEEWGFIPPDLLPRLKNLMSYHCYMLDGTLWVREIWVDQDGDKSKDPTEFKLIVTMGERRGGKHWFALDITDHLNPKFLWIFPRSIAELEGSVINTTLEDQSDLEKMGETWNETDPALPQIGPIAVQNPASQQPYDYYIIGINGGLYPDEDTSTADVGRRVYFLDAYTGKKMWEFAYDTAGVNQYLTNSVPGSVALLDTWDENYAQTSSLFCEPGDCLFDHAFFGDTSGSLWMIAMTTPAVLDTTGRITNTDWTVVRFFKSDTGEPFYYLPQIGVTRDITGKTTHWLIAGTGDRMEVSNCDSPPAGTYNRLYVLQLPEQLLNAQIDPLALSATPYSDSSYFGYPLGTTVTGPGQTGFYYELGASAKVVYPAQLLAVENENGEPALLVLFSSFYPDCATGTTAAASASVEALNAEYCEGGAKSGVSYLHAFDLLTAEPGFAGGAYQQEIGVGLPTPPNFIRIIGESSFSIQLLSAGSSGDITTFTVTESNQLYNMIYVIDLDFPWLHRLRHENFKIPSIP